MTYTATSLSAGTSYTFWVAAVNYVGTGALSAQKTQLAAEVPSKPNAPVVTGSYNSMSLTWTEPYNGGVAILDYDIYWDPDGNASDDFVKLATTSDLFYTVNSGITQGTTYKFRILARNSIGFS